MEATLFDHKQSIEVRAILMGERIDLRSLETARRLAMSPLILTSGESGCAAIFRYGAVVLFGLEPMEEVAFLSQIESMVIKPYPDHETEQVTVYLDPKREELVDRNGDIVLREFSIDRLQIVADILGKSVVLGRYESRVAEAFDRIEPLAETLQIRGKGLGKDRELMRHIGDTLLIQHKMVGRVEVSEKPEILWDHPKLERLYVHLESEYELRERHLALERKLELISRTVETQLDLLHNNRSLRVEWYIVILIVVEILLTLYEMFFKAL
ncbi:hypothetical protein U27_05757 [Candidatus Vecturithrix granuli]|uniref:DUF155 domain-containing protein n=1 Tax=Vecturithrix granuli TaxID=1499967 RepID=A0A081C2H7_VECG1|nr:hypothetical protein U27_05757 [Candidatus Vecturithrix granuli]